MKYLLSFLIIIHGCLHLMGFLKAFKLALIKQINAEISRISGVLWLVTFFLFIISVVVLFAKSALWFLPLAGGVIFSTVLIITAWKDAKMGSIANLILLAAALIGYGTWSFYGKYHKEVASGFKQSPAWVSSKLSENDIKDLPEVVKRYIRITGSLNKPKVAIFSVECTGKLRQKDGDWMPLSSEQYNFIDGSTRLFFLKASMKRLPVAGFHCFRNGDAFMDIRIFSLFKVQYQSGKEMGITETVTFFNDMVCMAPATLIDKRIKWMNADSNKVRAEFINNGISISAWLFFNEKGELVNFVSDDRSALMKDGTLKRLRWSTPLTEYKEMNGYRLGTKAAVIYAYPDGDFCYGTFSLEKVIYNPEPSK